MRVLCTYWQDNRPFRDGFSSCTTTPHLILADYFIRRQYKPRQENTHFVEINWKNLHSSTLSLTLWWWAGLHHSRQRIQFSWEKNFKKGSFPSLFRVMLTYGCLEKLMVFITSHSNFHCKQVSRELKVYQ